MRRFFAGLLCASLLTVTVASVPVRAEDQAIPTTIHGGGQKVKQGGREVGAGFRGIGRGIKKMFTGRRSKEDFKQGKDVGIGFADMGKGVAGVGRGTGRDVKHAFTGDAPAPATEEK